MAPTPQDSVDATNSPMVVHDSDEEMEKAAQQLRAACSHGDLEKCKQLIDGQGALPWHQDSQTGWTALHHAAGEWSCPPSLLSSADLAFSDNGSLDLVRYLLRNGAVWNIGAEVSLSSQNLCTDAVRTSISRQCWLCEDTNV